MVNEWVFEARTKILELEGKDGRLPLSGYTVFAGFNASLKSIIARSIYGLAVGSDEGVKEVKKLARHPDDSVCLRLGDKGERCYSGNDLRGEVRGHLVAELIPDYRLFLREALAIEGIFQDLLGQVTSIEELCRDHLGIIERGKDLGFVEEGEAEKARMFCDRIITTLSEDLKEVIRHVFILVDRLKHYKSTASDHDLYLLRNVENEVLDKAVRILNDIRREDLVPLRAELLPGGLLGLRVYDTRFDQRYEVPLDLVSSSIASYMTMDLAINVLAQPVDTILLVIEEPEEGLAPPQQYLFSLLLARYQSILQRERGKDVKIVITTHSPYVVHAAVTSGARVYYARYNWATHRFRVEEKPYSIFAQADRIALSLKEPYKNYQGDLSSSRANEQE